MLVLLLVGVAANNIAAANRAFRTHRKIIGVVTHAQRLLTG